MINYEQKNLEVMANKIIEDIKKNPFLYNTDFISDYTEEELKMFESILLSKMPNLVIRHSDTDTSKDVSKQLFRVRNILSNNMQPYFIDFPKRKKESKKR